METRRYRLRFTGDQAHLESAYREYLYTSSLVQTRWVLVFGLLLYGLFGFVDAVLQPELLSQFLVVRFGMVIPFGLGVVIFSFTRCYQRYHQLLLFLAFLVAGLGIELLIILLDPPATYLYYAGVCQVVIILFTLIPMRFLLATLCAWLIVICYWITAIWFMETPREILVNNSVFFITTNLISMFAGYLIQMRSRQTFLLNYLLRQEKLKVELLNSDLEDRVQHRIAELYIANRKIAGSEAMYRDVVENINDAIYKIDREGIVSYVSPVMESITGYASKEVEGQPFKVFIHPDDLPRIEQRFTDLIRGDLVPSEYRMVAKSGDIVWVRSSSNPIYQAGELVGFRGVLSDISKSKELELQLQQSRRMESIGTLAGGIAHDFNNILASILGYAELSAKHLEKGSPLDGYIKAIIISGRRARDLIQQILTFARKADAAREMVRIGDVVDESLRLIESTIPPAIQLNAEVMTASCVYAVRAQIHQMILNLVTNAVHAMEVTGGTLVVRVEESFLNEHRPGNLRHLPAGDYIRIKVSDTGHGIPEDILDSIFEPYFSTREIGKGSGLGLSVVHGIVSDCDGAILIDSVVDEGTTFTVYLPVVSSRLEPLESDDDDELLRGTERIMIVEDERALLEMAEEFLSDLGYQVSVFEDGDTAWAYFQKNSAEIDVVITDLVMPGLSGRELAIKMIEDRPDIPIIVMTGFSTMLSRSEAEKLGIQGFFYKPVAAAEIARKIRELIDSSTE